jgi:hypothetical protein
MLTAVLSGCSSQKAEDQTKATGDASKQEEAFTEPATLKFFIMARRS